MLIPAYAKLAAVALVLAGVATTAGIKGYSAGKAHVQAQYDAFLATQHQQALDQLQRQQAALLAYQEQIAHADAQRAENDRILADLRRKPAVRLRCTSQGASPDAVPAAATGTSGEPARAGIVQEGSGTGAESFDPAPLVMAMADRADDLVESCRAALGKWPQSPSNP